MQTKVKSTDEIASIRESGRMLGTVLNTLVKAAEPGMTTLELNNIAAEELKKLGGEPSFLGYQGFPAVLCVSLNEEVVHGIPSNKRVIAVGDIVSMDFGVTYRGMVSDAARSVIAGKAKQQRHVELVRYTLSSLDAGIQSVHHQVRTGDIGASIQAVLEKYHYGIVRDLVGHGVGHELHEDPNIPNYGRRNTGPWLESGMTIAIEPMATLGTDRVSVGEDGWTIVTADKSWAAHFEDTVLITQDGCEILTRA